MFLLKAMRYYRLWIYTCNAVLFISVLVFCFAASLILSDNRRQLVNSVRLYQPSFLYAYLAIFLQGGLIQVLGCWAALRMNEKLLNAYWISLLVLLIGDIFVGGIWMVRFDSLTDNLTADLHGRLRAEYADKSSQFRRIFDELQTDSQCCGVESPLDFNSSFWQMTETEYFVDYERKALNNSLDHDHIDVDVNGEDHDDEELDSQDLLLPWSCCIAEYLREQKELDLSLDEPEALANTIRGRLLAKSQGDKKDPEDPIMPPSFGIRKVQFHTLRKKVGKEYNQEDPIWEMEKWCIYSPTEGGTWHHQQGCAEPLKEWVNSSGDALFVIGFCVIAFLKLTFLGILHYEIKEMIQKIRLVQKERQQLNGDLAAALGLGPISNSSSRNHSPKAEMTGMPQQQQPPQQLNGEHRSQFVRPTQLIPVNTVVTNTGATITTQCSLTASADNNKQLTMGGQHNHVLHESHANNLRQTAI